MSKYVVVECASCDAVVKAEALGVHRVEVFDENLMVRVPTSKVTLASCPSCLSSIVARQEFQGEDDYGESWSRALRVWPRPIRDVDGSVPAIVGVSLEEAQRCFRAGAYTACVVMCGRAVEGMGKHFGTKVTLQKALDELLKRDIIDKRLFEWGDELRKHRNLAAHATGEKFSQEDATDLLEFVMSISEYVFVLTPRFQEFMKRRKPTAKTGPLEEDAESK